MKKRTGGRVTPKGTQPPSTPSKQKAQSDDGAAAPKLNPRFDPGHGRPGSGPIGPTRSGPRGGNR